ncbi:MAG: EF-Tu/IF-2/RF-3 family GTPase [archaeon]
MKSLTISVISDSKELREKICRELAKKSPGEEDVNFYHQKSGEMILSVLEAARFPEKLPSLLFTLPISDLPVVAVEKLTPAIGEAIIALDLSGMRRGIFFTTLLPEQLAPLTKGTVCEGYRLTSDLQELRELVNSTSSERQEGAAKGIVDHSFNVKGVGSVALGFVARGTIRVHDKLSVFPSGKKIEVRSIQMHDDDYDSASAGDRFGISFRGLDASELSRGDVLAQEGQLQVAQEISLSGRLSKFAKKPLEAGETIHLSVGLQMKTGKIAEGTIAPGGEGSLKISLEAPIAFDQEDRFLLIRLNEKALRVVGSGKVLP